MLNKIINTIFGNAFFAMSQLFLLVFISRNFSVEYMGLYSYVLAVSTIMFMITNIGLRNVLATDQCFEFDNSLYINSRFYLSTFSFIILNVFFYFSMKNEILLCIFIVFVKYIDSIQDIFIGFLHRKQQFSVMRSVNLIKSSFVFFAMFIAYDDNVGIEAIFVILSLFNIILLFSLALYTKFEFLSFNKVFNRFKILLMHSFPFALVGVLASFNLNMPRFFIQDFLGFELLAVYTAMYQIVFFGSVIVLAFGQSILPHLTILIQNKSYKCWVSLLIKSIFLILLACIILNIIIFFYGIETMNFIFGDEIVFRKEHLFLFTILGFLSYVLNILTYAFQSLRNGSGLTKFSLALTILHIISVPIFMGWYGLAGVIYATSIYYLISAVLIIIFCRIIIRSKNEDYPC